MWSLSSDRDHGLALEFLKGSRAKLLSHRDLSLSSELQFLNVNSQLLELDVRQDA
jgi:hypothetical protein